VESEPAIVESESCDVSLESGWESADEESEELGESDVELESEVPDAAFEIAALTKLFNQLSPESGEDESAVELVDGDDDESPESSESVEDESVVELVDDDDESPESSE
jgi:hypothetical protein